MIRISHTLLLGLTLTTIVHGMEHEPKSNLITGHATGSNLRTAQDMQITPNLRAAQSNLRTAQSNLKTTQSIELAPTIEITSPKEDRPQKAVSYKESPLQKIEPIQSSPLTIQSTNPIPQTKKHTFSSLSHSSQSIQHRKAFERKREDKYPTLPLIQSTGITFSEDHSPRKNEILISSSRAMPQHVTSTSSSRESSPRIEEKTQLSTTLTQSTTSLKESSSRKNEIIHSSTSTSITQSGSTESSPRKKNKSIFSLMTQSSSSLLYDDSDTENPLLKATKNNNLSNVLEILNINAADNEGNTPFIIAARDGRKKIIIALLKRSDIKPNIQNKQKMTALHCAAREGRKKILEILVRDPRIDTALQELNGWTFLNYLNLNPSCKKLKNDAFGRITVDTFVNKEVEALYKLMINNLLTINLTHEDLQRSTNMIKDNIANVAKKQSTQHKDRALNPSAIIPGYVSDLFIEWMIRWRLFYLNEATLSSLDQAILLQQTLANVKKDEKLRHSLNETIVSPLDQTPLLQQTITDIKQYEEFPDYLAKVCDKEKKLEDYL